MATLLEKLFGGPTPSVEDVEGKLADLEIRRSAKKQQQALLQQKIAELKGRVQETLAEGMLSDSGDISKRRRMLRDEMADLRRRSDDLEEELDALNPLETTLNAEKAAARSRVKVAEWDGKALELLTLAKEIEPLVVALGAKLVKAASLVSDLSYAIPTTANYRPSALWIDAVRTIMARHFDGSEIPGVLSRSDVHNQIFAQIADFPDYIETNLKRLRGNLSEG